MFCLGITDISRQPNNTAGFSATRRTTHSYKQSDCLCVWDGGGVQKLMRSGRGNQVEKAIAFLRRSMSNKTAVSKRRTKWHTKKHCARRMASRASQLTIPTLAPASLLKINLYKLQIKCQNRATTLHSVLTHMTATHSRSLTPHHRVKDGVGGLA